jgi:hypothetical protein
LITSKKMRWAGYVAGMGEKGNTYRGLMGKPKWKRSLGRPRSRWEDNIKMDLKEISWKGVDCIHLPQDRDK